ncbi:MAG TPA: hypothetical protein PLJ27_23965 [Polyangiaceae bacterium]|nr:hypothetical protein [Polyangiaceae bacterium]HNZ20772.1 hypothetical protein [Polyangiaceae bacterium]HOD23846.1 hypothetical protein [Polyangiaceae bacterium]HOE48201.1 hypothetical protein [Polyangiaceae bacterium]HOG99302.1 hypothetical protein [Polyangiaceae bacterium]
MGSVQRLGWTLGFMAACAAFSPDVSAAGAALHQATGAQKQEAQKLFLNAKQSFDKQQYDAALTGFLASYDVVASPNSLLMAARALVALDRLEEAFATYQEVIEVAKEAAAKDKKYAPSLESAEKEFEELRPRIALVTFDIVGATSDTELFINDQPMARDRWDKQIPVRAGVVSITAKSPGKPDFQQDLTLSGGASSQRIDLQAFWAPPPPPPSTDIDDESSAHGNVDLLGLDKRTWAYIAGGVGAAGVVTFGVFGALNQSKYNNLQDDCPNGRCPSDRSDDINAGRRYQTIANVGLVVGVVGLGTGTALYFLSKDSGREQPTTQVGFGPGSVTVQGTF